MTRARPFAGQTRRLAAPGVADLDADASYVFSSPGTEARGRAAIWDACVAARADNCIEVLASSPSHVTLRRGGNTEDIALNDDNTLGAALAIRAATYIDISGLPHHVWAPLIRAGFRSMQTLYATYVEPDSYKRHPSPTSRTEFDLSEGFRGIEPLPGFAKLRGPEDEKDSVLVALLGFEGNRARHVALALDPVPRIYAIVGVPGFRIEYPQITHASNEDFLSEHRAHANIRLARASCPFESYEALGELHRDCGGRYMYIAPIGTKPHALGAICYALKNPDTTEIMYDNPVRKPGRTEGVRTFHIYKLKPSHVAL